MVKLEIVNEENNHYNLKDENNNTYNFILEFHDIEDKPKEGEIICMSAELLNPRYAGYSNMYAFGSMESQYGKENISLTDIDVMILVKDGLEIYLKRLYG